MLKLIIVFITGFIATFIITYYFAWTTSIAQPVNWNQVLSFAAFCAPFVGGFTALIIWVGFIEK